MQVLPKNECECNHFGARVNYPELYFLLKVSTSNIKIKITHYSVIGDECIWQGRSPTNSVSVSDTSNFKSRRMCLKQKALFGKNI